ncbi:DinB family protein [Cellulophaga sp. F20128]|uniref:DinB family protein n=1 Tax=Cellulophaga sp. F20128 TaxID=2926413 RepID=UPI001FF1BDC7|nr:DinB family protein [Cellulophaga sp. F20128]MCK0157855.1 DinB family protein [Cellulophaga sp. F20128]
MKAIALSEQEYNIYYKRYIDLVASVDLLDALHQTKSEFESLMLRIPEDKVYVAYAVNKWTIAEVLVHIIDTERVFQYRALCFSRFDGTPLPGYEQDDYVNNSRAEARSKNELLDEFIAVRASTIKLFETFNETQLRFIGNANNSPLSAAAAGFIICGHQIHHAQIITEKYSIG